MAEAVQGMPSFDHRRAVSPEQHLAAPYGWPGDAGADLDRFLKSDYQIGMEDRRALSRREHQIQC